MAYFFTVDGFPTASSTVQTVNVTGLVNVTTPDPIVDRSIGIGDLINGQEITALSYVHTFSETSTTSVNMGDGTSITDMNNNEAAGQVNFQFIELADGTILATLGGYGQNEYTSTYYRTLITDEVIANGSGVTSFTLGANSVGNGSWTTNGNSNQFDMGPIPASPAPNGVFDGSLGADTITFGDGLLDGAGETFGTTGTLPVTAVSAGAGNDVVDASTATVAVTIDGGGGNDTITGGSAGDSLSGGDGADSILGGGGSDTISGGTGNDHLYGGAGDDDIAVGGGDVAYGGSGDDEFTIDTTDTATDFATTIDGGTDATDGNGDDAANGDAGDILNLGMSTSDLTVDIGADSESGTVDGLDATSGDTDITFSEIENVITGSGDDTINASGLTNLDAGAGTDTLDLSGSPDGTYYTWDDKDTGSGTVHNEDGSTMGTFTNVESITGAPAHYFMEYYFTNGGFSTSNTSSVRVFDKVIIEVSDDDSIGIGSNATKTGVDVETANNPVIVGVDDPTYAGLVGFDLSFTLIGYASGVTTGYVTSLSGTNTAGQTLPQFRATIEDDLGSTGTYDNWHYNFSVVNAVENPDYWVQYIGGVTPTNITASYITNEGQFQHDFGFSTPVPDGEVDGENDAELMGLGYDDAGANVINTDGSTGAAATDNGGGDVITTDADTIHGNGGDDIINADAGNDVVYGGDDNDTIDGGAGSDTLYGDAGEDLITAGSADDVFGGDGDDTVVVTGTLDDGTNLDLVGGEGDETTNGDLLDLSAIAKNLTQTQKDDIQAHIDAGSSGSFTYDDGAGNISTVNYSEFERVNLVPCFTRGTMIETVAGEMLIETLEVGDMVITHDRGPQAIRWIGSRVVPAIGKHAPVMIKAGALGNTRDIMVSPQHRMLLTGFLAEVFTGEEETLVAAKHLVNGDKIYIAEGGEVEYFHMLFDTHEIITANGAATESLHIGEQTIDGFGATARDEILAIFPDLRTDIDSYGVLARPEVPSYVARALTIAQK